MSMLKTGLSAFAAVALVLTAANPAGAASAEKSAHVQGVNAGTGDATDFSSQRRGRRYARRGGGGGAALFGAAAVGIIGSAIAAGVARDRYDDGYYYAQPGYYGGGPEYDGGPGYGYGGGYGPGYRW